MMKLQSALSQSSKANPTIFLFEEGQIAKGQTFSRQQTLEVLLLIGFDVSNELFEMIIEKLKYLINLDKTQNINIEVRAFR